MYKHLPHRKNFRISVTSPKECIDITVIKIEKSDNFKAFLEISQGDSYHYIELNGISEREVQEGLSVGIKEDRDNMHLYCLYSKFYECTEPESIQNLHKTNKPKYYFA